MWRWECRSYNTPKTRQRFTFEFKGITFHVERGQSWTTWLKLQCLKGHRCLIQSSSAALPSILHHAFAAFVWKKLMMWIPPYVFWNSPKSSSLLEQLAERCWRLWFLQQVPLWCFHRWKLCLCLQVWINVDGPWWLWWVETSPSPSLIWKRWKGHFRPLRHFLFLQFPHFLLFAWML